MSIKKRPRSASVSPSPPVRKRHSRTSSSSRQHIITGQTSAASPPPATASEPPYLHIYILLPVPEDDGHFHHHWGLGIHVPSLRIWRVFGATQYATSEPLHLGRVYGNQSQSLSHSHTSPSAGLPPPPPSPVHLTSVPESCLGDIREVVDTVRVPRHGEGSGQDYVLEVVDLLLQGSFVDREMWDGAWGEARGLVVGGSRDGDGDGDGDGSEGMDDEDTDEETSEDADEELDPRRIKSAEFVYDSEDSGDDDAGDIE